MKLATLACLAALCLVGLPAQAATGEQSKAPAPAGSNAPAEAQAHPAVPVGETAAGPRPAATARAERRRRSYAACNRASHQRGLRGGKRRRFLIRCRLGYERTRGQAGQTAPAPLPPSRKP